jgi:hypothetical protein
MKELRPLEEGSRRLRLNKNEITAIIETLKNHLHDRSNKIRLFALQSLANLALDDAKLRPQIIAVLDEVARTGSPTIKTAGRKLLSTLRKL